MTTTTPYLQNYTKISDILAENHEIRLMRKFEIRYILRLFSVPLNVYLGNRLYINTAIKETTQITSSKCKADLRLFKKNRANVVLCG